MSAEIIDFNHALAQKGREYNTNHPIHPTDKARAEELIKKVEKEGLLTKGRRILSKII